MKSGFFILTNLRRLLSRLYKSHRTMPSLTSYSTKCLTEASTPNDEETERAKSSTEVFTSWGCNEDDLSNLFARNPGLKNADIAGLESKLSLLSGLGVAPSELVKMVKLRPRLLSCRLNRCFHERLEFFATLFDSKAALAKAIVQNPSLLLYDFHAKIVPTVQLYEGLGLTKRDLAAMLVHRPTLIPRTSFDGEKMDYIRRIGVSPSSKLYKYIVTLVGISRVQTIRKKVTNLERFGLSEDDVLDLVGRSPLLLTLSVEKVERNVRFVLGMMRLPAEVVLRQPCLLYLNLEAVMRPRVLLAQKMREMGVARGIEEGRMIGALRMREERFFEVFVASQPAEVRAELASFYAKAKGVKRLAFGSKQKQHGGFPF